MIEIEYKNFKEDCDNIIWSFLSQYNFKVVKKTPEEYKNIYQNKYWVIQISMLEYFPHIGVSFDFLTIGGKYIKRSLIDSLLKIDQSEMTRYYQEFSSLYDLNQYKNQMIFATKLLDKFYKRLLTGEFSEYEFI